MKIYNIKNIDNISEKIDKICSELKINSDYSFNSSNCLRIKLQRQKNDKYQRTGYIYSEKLERYNKINSVCFHGFRDFLLKLYEIDESFRVVTSQTTYNNKDHFINSYLDIYYNNIGSMMNPQNLGDSCLCNH